MFGILFESSSQYVQGPLKDKPSIYSYLSKGIYQACPSLALMLPQKWWVPAAGQVSNEVIKKSQQREHRIDFQSRQEDVDFACFLRYSSA